MTLTPAHGRPRYRPRRVVVLAALSCLLGGLAVIHGGDRAAARPERLRPGAGRHAGHDFVGYYLTRDGTKVYCLSPRRATPARLALHSVARYPGVSAAASAALAYALATWGDARSGDAAAVESQVVNTLAGNRRDVARRSRSLPVRLRRTVTAHVAEARSRRGPYRVSVTLPAAPLPGASGTGTVRVLSASGRPVPDALVRLQLTSNVGAPHTLRTQRTGTVRFRYRALDVGPARVRAVVGALPPTALRVSSPRPGQQRLAAAAGRVAVSANAAYRATPGGITAHYSCASDCAGRPRVTLVACARGGTAGGRLVYRVGRAVVVRSFAASARRRCATTRLTIADRTRVSATWQYRTRRGWSRPVPAAGSFVVDCPPAPALTVTLGHDCRSATITVRTLPSRRPTMLAIGGWRPAVVRAVPGRAATWTTSVPCGTRLPVTVRGGVQRVSGGWNLGPVTALTTP